MPNYPERRKMSTIRDRNYFCGPFFSLNMTYYVIQIAHIGNFENIKHRHSQWHLKLSIKKYFMKCYPKFYDWAGMVYLDWAGMVYLDWAGVVWNMFLHCISITSYSERVFFVTCWLLIYLDYWPASELANRECGGCDISNYQGVSLKNWLVFTLIGNSVLH